MLRSVMLTPEQLRAIDAQRLIYADGVLHTRLYDGSKHDGPSGSVAVEFHYIRGEQPDVTGLETTIFAADGTVVTSQDFG
jgi:hypothetical protein